MARAGIQLYTLRTVEKSVPELLEVVADAGFEGVEFYGAVEDADPVAVTETLEETGLEAIGPHIGTERLEEDLEEVLDLYGQWGCEYYTEPWFGGEHFESRTDIEALGERLDAVAEKLTDHGVSFHYHNHAQEFTDLGDTTGLEYLIDRTDAVEFQIDAGTAASSGVPPEDLVRDLGDRTSLFHAKDYDIDAGESAPLGQGDVDVEACVDAFTDVGGDWFIYEYEGENPLDTLEDSAELLNDLL